MTINRRDFLLAGAAGLLASSLPTLPTSAQADPPPLRLGIIGSDNSHAEAFAALLNKDQDPNGRHVPGAKITHICGERSERTQYIAETYEIPHIVASPEDMMDQVDGVLCLWRHGSRHVDMAPFLARGMPMFIDKPFTTRVEDAQKLLDAAEQGNTVLTSFSCLRYEPGFVEFASGIRDPDEKILGGWLCGPADRNSEYDGIFAYGVHTVEMLLTLWGEVPASVYAQGEAGMVHTFCRFTDGRRISLLWVEKGKAAFQAAVFGEKRMRYVEVKTDALYYEGLKVILEMFRRRVMPLSPKQLLEPVRLLCAIQTSLQTQAPVSLANV